MSQLPYERGGNDFSFWVVMLHNSIGMLRTLFYARDGILLTYPINRDGWRSWWRRNDACWAPASAAAAYPVLL